MAANILASYDVHSPEYGQSLKIDVVEGLDAAHLEHIEQAWKPIVEQHYAKALLEYFTLQEKEQTPEAFTAILERLGIPDRHWDWRRKSAIAPGTQRKLYALLNGDQVEAVMMLLFGRETRLATPGLPLVYVDYLATAPWNRPAIQNPTRFRRMGTVLLGTAVEVSRMQGLDGRCALHSLPSAEGFYRQAGMQDLGCDSAYYDMHYFEFDAAAARAFTA